MLNIFWLGMMLLAVVFGIINGSIDAVANAVTSSAKLGFEIGLGLTGILTFWLGIMRVAEEGGLVKLLARLLHPLLKRLFNDVPANDPALGAIVMNIAANMFGLNNAATPLGLKAMTALERLNPKPGVATNAMCTFLAINTSSVQLLPVSGIAFLAAGGASHPAQIIISALLATLISTVVGIIAVKTLEKLPRYRLTEDKPDASS